MTKEEYKMTTEDKVKALEFVVNGLVRGHSGQQLSDYMRQVRTSIGAVGPHNKSLSDAIDRQIAIIALSGETNITEALRKINS